MKQVLALLKQGYTSCVSHTCVLKKTKHPNNSKSRVCNNETPTCSKGSLNSAKVKPIPSKYLINENLKTALGSTAASFSSYKLFILGQMGIVFIISYACRSANTRPVFFHPAQSFHITR